jgi:pyruvate/2-oxoglutarate dehydrogenase complex dihydrolipoamide dehydrogenase (E3) component
MKYDAVIIGSGQAGTPFASALAEIGWKVAFVEQANLGGTCVNVGCTPTKTMVQRASVAHYARDAARWGVQASDVRVDLPKVVAQKNEVVLSFRNGNEKRVAEHPNIRLYRGHARFTAPHKIVVGTDEMESDKIFINTGARPRIPAIAGLAGSGYLTSDTIMGLTAVPEHLIVLGGSYIGLEFGQLFRRFGSEVTVIQQVGQIVPREDPEVAAELQRSLEAEGIKFLLDAGTTRVQRTAEKGGNSITLDIEKAGKIVQISGSNLLIAIGRRPNTDDLGLDLAGIETNASGFIPVNGKLETNVPGVWALGDVKGGPAFTHISYNDYQIVYANLIEGKNLSIDHRIVPYCLFTSPELGAVGLTEKEARAKGYKLKIGTVPMSRVSRAIERDEIAGLMKLIVDASNDRILGATILSVDGGETVHILYVLMLADQPYTLLKGAGAIYIHPTFAEGLFFLMDAVKPID